VTQTLFPLCQGVTFNFHGKRSAAFSQQVAFFPIVSLKSFTSPNFPTLFPEINCFFCFSFRVPPPSPFSYVPLWQYVFLACLYPFLPQASTQKTLFPSQTSMYLPPGLNFFPPPPFSSPRFPEVLVPTRRFQTLTPLIHGESFVFSLHVSSSRGKNLTMLTPLSPSSLPGFLLFSDFYHSPFPFCIVTGI